MSIWHLLTHREKIGVMNNAPEIPIDAALAVRKFKLLEGICQPTAEDRFPWVIRSLKEDLENHFNQEIDGEVANMKSKSIKNWALIVHGYKRGEETRLIRLYPDTPRGRELANLHKEGLQRKLKDKKRKNYVSLTRHRVHGIEGCLGELRNPFTNEPMANVTLLVG